MRIALTVEALSPNLSGIGRYTWELASRIGRSASIDDLTFYRDGRMWTDPAVFLSDAASPSRRRRFRLPRRLRKYVEDRGLRDRLFHGPNYFLPPRVEGGVITVHDLSVFRFPESHPVERIRHFEREFASSIARAAHVITDSRTVRDEVIAFAGLAPERVTAVPLGVSEAFRPHEEDVLRPVLGRYGLEPDRYALCVSTLDPRKKIEELLAAWMDLPPDLHRMWPLVVIGSSGWLSDDLQAMLARGAEKGWVKYLGFVPETDLPALYAGARLFVYPSIYEGFGLPPVEAMASGVPVVISSAACLVEVAQGAALQVKPEDREAFGKMLVQGLTDESWRASARRQGLIVAASYCWDRCATETVSVYVNTVASR
ncbi:glycosyltransferase family 1 protein [Sphingobium aquiterrae]|uniref:glycosyltransferase family 4 protein n=1 Tax=Sphingobium aquiterrae TaxID=2038656 RepID=UPI00301AE0EF